MIEFVVMAAGVLVPMAYLALAAAGVQAGVFASTQAVREAGRAFASAATADEGRARAIAAARLAFADHGFALPPDAVRITCPVGPCLSPGSTVQVDLEWSVELPWLPDSLAGAAPASVPVSATHLVPVDDYRGNPT